jgi:hypothetical protein
MGDLNEPEDGGYVAVGPRGEVSTVRVYCRRDRTADLNGLGEARWFSRTDRNEPARTWAYIVDLGPLAYVGQFVDRRAA